MITPQAYAILKHLVYMHRLNLPSTQLAEG